MDRLLFSVLLVFFVVCENEGKVYDRCTLARELKSKGIPQDQVDNFVCLVENNSFDTEWTGGPYEDGTKNFGIFQVNNKDWCEIGKPGGFCFTDCTKYTDDDITDDFMCAKEVHRRFGFDPFWVWTQKCRPAGPDLSYCLTEGNIDTNNVGSGNDNESNVTSDATETTSEIISSENDGVTSDSTETTSTPRGSTVTTSTPRGSTESVDRKVDDNNTQDSNSEGNFFKKVEKGFEKLSNKINKEVSKLVQIFSIIKSR